MVINGYFSRGREVKSWVPQESETGQMFNTHINGFKLKYTESKGKTVNTTKLFSKG